MKVIVNKLTDEELMREACRFTMNNKVESTISLENIYKCEHSPMRTQLFKVCMYGIPSFVSTHLVRHSAVGQQHYVGSNRSDRGGSKQVGRYTPVDHMIILNAQHLISLAHARLCFKASVETTQVVMKIRDGVAIVDRDLAEMMVPKCLYTKGCNELISCGYYEGVK